MRQRYAPLDEPTGTGRIHVMHATTVHSPFDVRIFHKQCVTLAGNGYKVTLAQRGECREQVKGVIIEPLKTFESRFLRMTAGVWSVVRLAMALRPQVLHIHDPELIWGAVILKALGVRIIYDVHENLSLDIVAKPWVPKPLKWPLGAFAIILEYLAALFFDHICAATDGIGRRFPARKTSVIRNSPIIANFDKFERPPLVSRAPNLIYVGGLGGGSDVKGVDMMLAVLSELPASSRIRLILGGREPSLEFVAILKTRPGGDRIDFIGWVDPESLPQIYAKAFAALVLYPPLPNNVESEPVKFFEAMAAGVPVIASDFPLFKRFVEEWSCGLAVDAGDPKHVARIILELEKNRSAAQDMGENGLHTVREFRSWEKMAEELLRIYCYILGSRRRDSIL